METPFEEPKRAKRLRQKFNQRRKWCRIMKWSPAWSGYPGGKDRCVAVAIRAKHPRTFCRRGCCNSGRKNTWNKGYLRRTRQERLQILLLVETEKDLDVPHGYVRRFKSR